MNEIIGVLIQKISEGIQNAASTGEKIMLLQDAESRVRVILDYVTRQLHTQLGNTDIAIDQLVEKITEVKPVVAEIKKEKTKITL